MKTKSIALGGILLAFTVILLYGAAMFPNMRLSLFTAASLMGGVVIIESGAKAAVLFYAASVLLGFMIVPNLLGMLPYAMCFGLYPLVKYRVELLKKRPLEMALKLLFLNGTFAIMIFLSKEVFFGDSDFGRFPIYLLFVLMQGAFIAYDIVFSMFVQFYLRRKR